MRLPPHPFTTWPRRHRTAWLVGLSVPSALFIVWATIAQPLGDEDIVAFEFARTVGRAEEILAAWRAEDVIGLAKAMQLADIVYPFVYAFAIAGGCVGAAAAWARAGSDRMAQLANTLAWVATSAIVFDYVENLGLAVSLWGEPAAPWPQVAFVAAVLKFTAIAAGLAGVLSWPVAARRAA